MKRFRFKDYVISFLIIFISLLYFADRFIPAEIESEDILGIDIGNFGFLNFKDFIYYSKMKILIICFSITWYLTCKHWWRHAILVIIIVEIFKLATTLNSSSSSMDEIEYITSLPLTLPIIFLLIFISLMLNKARHTSEILNLLDNEIDEAFFEINKVKQQKYKALKQRLDVTKACCKNDKEKYLKELLNIRNSFYKF